MNGKRHIIHVPQKVLLPPCLCPSFPSGTEVPRMSEYSPFLFMYSPCVRSPPTVLGDRTGSVSVLSNYCGPLDNAGGRRFLSASR